MKCLDDNNLFSITQDNLSNNEGTILEGSMGKIFSGQKKTKSILGALFGTINHDSKLIL